MPIDKVAIDVEVALEGVNSGATILVGGFGGAGSPTTLLEALAKKGLEGLTVVSNNAGSGHSGMAALLLSGSVSKVVCSYPRMPGSVVFDELYEAGRIELELCAQGTLTERIRAGGAGIGGFYTRTGVGTMLAEGREVRLLDGVPYLFEAPIRGDVALVGARLADRWGNLTYDKVGRNFGPTMAMAARLTIAEVDDVVPLGSLDPEIVVTPGFLVDRVVRR